ncbi:hypothetical protein FQA39_LY16577 [Lamprigera yunnana]|nr:hypothetical protein FQA39_LY16577 [Lamprigera yunnana]
MNVIVIITCTLIGISRQINVLKVVNDFEGAVENDSQNCYKTFDFNRQKLDGAWRIADDSGRINQDIFQKYLETDEGTATRVYDACKDSKGDNNCETIYQFISGVHIKIRSPNL